MKNNFTITGFADEISGDLATQIRVLKENKISHLELRAIAGKNVSDFTLEEAEHYVDILNENQIKVSSIGSPIGKIGIEDDFAAHLEKFKHVLAIARIFKAPYIRMFSFFMENEKNPDDYKDKVVARWQQFLASAKAYPEITLLHENEKGIYGDTPERCAALLEALNDDQVKVAFDPANFVQCEVEVYPHAFDMLKEKIAYLHIKDALYANHKVTPAGLGDGKVADVLKGLVVQNFEGFASLEPHLSIFDGFAQLEKENVSIEPSDSDGEKLFTVASNALKKILVEEMDQEWK
ncbi:sugar phosphate isomerase/epimerase family protein [Enterococcus nangangensis]|uniref:sugar phosphate isomerase/epimerase family protein n=1 Tax=Enterococcus nangangensis TaxID=2559926 RepID=UPI0010F7D7B9|nr:TIM barrel protein [Enterococcus nangangensis]